ncbi:MAG: helicase-exonuclease AddAB subunit AddA [Lachnospiraceae bacterium]|nr:helicase-exonuclease AddAB subunit AddA [Lachnospiraceae bacterium]
MAEFKWSPEQQSVIDARNENVLVAAAAGSGKTAVLVERIVNRITDERNPIDIDRIVVVTFTKAAAAEMRERILSSIQKKMESMSETDPLYNHMCKQAVLIHNARITTIDSFCGYIVKNYFYEIELEPNYRIADSGEQKLLSKDAMEEVMEAEYAKADNELFLKMVDGYGDNQIREFVEQIHGRAQSYPWPQEWLDHVVAIYDTEDFYKSESVQKFISIYRQHIQSEKCKIEEYLKETVANEELTPFVEIFTNDIEILDKVLKCQGMDFVEALGQVKFKNNPKKNEGLSVYMSYIDKRGTWKKNLNESIKDFRAIFADDINEENKLVRPYIMKLVELTKAYTDSLDELKSQKNVYDFNDIEHFALHILRKADDPDHGITPTAEYMREYYEEVMIDEYQDSNYLQEEILSSICRQEPGRQNMFMVGDVKQSIYAFRQASPEIFTNKYLAYKADRTQGHVIDLSQNFRSRGEVLDGTNDVFEPLMQQDLGNVEYDDAARLVYGNGDYVVNDETAKRCQMEIIIGDYSKEAAEDFDFDNSDAYEAQIIANKIKEMIGNQMPVYDKEAKCDRPIRYSDIAILLRSPGKKADGYISILERNGIVAHATTSTGYFSAPEVVYVLNMLRVIDNPHQDVALTAALHGPAWNVTDDEMALIKQTIDTFPTNEGVRMDFADGLLKLYDYMAINLMSEIMGDAEDVPEIDLPDELNKKIIGFMEFLKEMREAAKDVAVHELIQMVIRRTGYIHYVSALPRGEARRANLQKLVDQAVAYETTSYKGLFNFINYIEYCQKYDVDMPEAELVSENDDAVKIMSIHKSKGLEYPVVFLARCNNKLENQDLKKNLIIHPDLGFGLKYIDYEKQIKYTPAYYNVVKAQVKEDDYGEEMRILYVAMTRAREKLFITSTVSASKSAEEYVDKYNTGTTRMSYDQRIKSDCYMDWILQATQYKRDMYPVQIVSLDDAAAKMVMDRGIIVKRRQEFESNVSDANEQLIDYIKSQYHHTYQYEKKVDYKTKYSVSEIKHEKMEEYERHEDSERRDDYAWGRSPLEDSIAEKKAKAAAGQSDVNIGAKTGTAVHRFMECYNFTDLEADKAVSFNRQKKSILAAGLMRDEDMELISQDKIVSFLESDLCGRMAAADNEDKLYREQPFVMSAMPEEIWPDKETNPENDPILIQGIIDVFFEEDGEIVLMDYKTDKVSGEEELIGRYKAQLNLYADAISKSRGQKVKEIIIYSFCLGKTIVL